MYIICLLYTSDAADDLLCVDLGGRRIIKKKKNTKQKLYEEDSLEHCNYAYTHTEVYIKIATLKYYQITESK